MKFYDVKGREICNGDRISYGEKYNAKWGIVRGGKVNGKDMQELVNLLLIEDIEDSLVKAYGG